MKGHRIYVILVFCCLFVIVIANQVVESLGLPLKIGTGISLCFLALLFFAYFKLFHKHLLVLPKGALGIFCVLFFLYLLFIIGRGDWQVSLNDFVSKFVDRNGFLVYSLPIIILTLPCSKYQKTILRICFYCSLMVIPLWLLNLDKLIMVGERQSYQSEGVGMWLPFVSALLLPMMGVLNRRERQINLAIVSLYFILMLINARRNVCLTFALFLLISCFTVARSLSRKKVLSQKVSYVAVILLIIIALFSAKPLLNGPFSFLKERGIENTRSSVEALFFADMLSSPVSDWVFGRGMDGTYEQIVVDYETGDVNEDRNMIETGYLNMLLKGGVVYILLVISAIVIAVLRLFKSQRPLSRYYAWILLVYILDMYTSNPVTIFYPRSIIFWLLISFSFSPRETLVHECAASH